MNLVYILIKMLPSWAARGIEMRTFNSTELIVRIRQSEV